MIRRKEKRGKEKEAEKIGGEKRKGLGRGRKHIKEVSNLNSGRGKEGAKGECFITSFTNYTLSKEKKAGTKKDETQ